MIVEGTRWKRVEEGSPETLPEGKLMRVKVGGRSICIVRNGGKLHALLDRCPHQGSSFIGGWCCLLYTSPSPRERTRSRMPSSA